MNNLKRNKIMKNVHLIPTDKPSRLIFQKNLNKIVLYSRPIDFIEDDMLPQHIYITNDEEIKEGEWCIDTISKHIYKHPINSNTRLEYQKKIILTTDQKLIKNGVQPIDDEFLEWFVKNPSCERVETPIVKLCTNCGQQYCDNRDCRGYNDEPEYLISYPENTIQRIITYCEGYEVNQKEIIIPKEEPKQECKKCFGTGEDQINDVGYKKCTNCNGRGEEPKQETLGEAAGEKK